MENSNSVFNELNEWYQQSLGQTLLAEIHLQLMACLPDLFGYHLLQLGLSNETQWLDESPINHRIIIVPDLAEPKAQLYGEFAQLPLMTNSVDVIFLPHTLAFVTDPEAVLTECDRILVPNGHLIIIDFNPISLWGLRKVFCFKQRAPWSGHYLSSIKLRKWLTEKDYQIKRFKSFVYRPPLHNSSIFNKLLFLETLGRLTWIYPGGLYLMLAQKQKRTLTRIKPIYSYKNIVIGKRYIQPTT